MKLRPLLALALLAPTVTLAAPATKTAAAKTAAAPAKSAAAPASSSPMQGLEVGGFVGYETDDVSGLSLRLDAELPFRELSPQVKLSFVGSIGYSRLTDSEGFADFTANVLKFVPAARFTMPVNPQFSVFGDAGLGLAYVGAKVETNVPFFGTTSVSDSTINLIMRLGVGAWYHVNPQLKLGAMLELDPYFGDFGFSGPGGSSQTTFLFQVGAMFRL